MHSSLYTGAARYRTGPSTAKLRQSLNVYICISRVRKTFPNDITDSPKGSIDMFTRHSTNKPRTRLELETKNAYT